MCGSGGTISARYQGGSDYRELIASIVRHSMPICIECRNPVSRLYHVLHSSNKSKKTSTAAPEKSTPALPSATPTSRNSGFATAATAGLGDVRLTQCPRCKRFADKYVEHDFVVLFIDLVLVKPQVDHLRDCYSGVPANYTSRFIVTCYSIVLVEMTTS